MDALDLELLEQEIRSQRSTLMNAIINRRDHPTYGYTKKDILHNLGILEGMLYAYSVLITGNWNGSKLSAIRRVATDLLGDDIDALRTKAQGA